MIDERKRAIWPWIAAVLVGLPVLYVASIGPACWIYMHLDDRDLAEAQDLVA